MGGWPARITSEDFLTPPEWQGEQPGQRSGAGRVGGVRLELVHAAGCTSLGRLYQQVPLRVLPPFRFGPSEPALLYLLNPTAGLLDGDAHLVQVEVGQGTRTVVAGQSATRIHPSVGGYCTQQWLLTVQPEAVVVVLPGPAIPFRGCRHYQRVEINLAERAGVVWGDVWYAGRYARAGASEKFQFRTLIQETVVRREGRLVFRDRFCWEGPWDADTAAWHFGGASACGSLLVLGAGGTAWQPPAQAASFRTAFSDTCLRWQGDSEAVTAQVVATALGAAAAMARQTPEQPWLLSAADLAPSHWFSLW